MVADAGHGVPPGVLIRNTAANVAGQLLYPLLAFVLVPFYIGRLGLEAYGLIGLMALVVSLLGIFTRGLGGALQLEVSRRTGSPDEPTLPGLLRSVETVYWAAAGVIAIALGTFALTAGSSWVKSDAITPSEIRICLVLLAARVALAFPHSVYQSLLIGTERQVLGSALNAGLALTAAAGGVGAVLVFDSVTAYYASEAIVAGLFLAVYRRAAYGVLSSGPLRADLTEVRNLMGISLALMWTSGIGLLLSTLDRLFVTAMLPVASLAVYTVAVMGGRLVMVFYNPFLQAAYPQMCRMVRSGSPDDQARDLARNHAVLLLIAAGAGVPLCGFAPEVLALWIGDPAVTQAGAPVLSVYVAGSLMLAFASVLYQWQTAAGRTGVAVRFNTVALVWFPIALALLISRIELLGGAIAWALYGALAWITNLLTTYGHRALPLRHMYVSVRTTVLALAPAVIFTLVARLAADQALADCLWGRAACGAGAGLCGAGVAFAVVRSQLVTRGAASSSHLSRPAFHAAGPD